MLLLPLAACALDNGLNHKDDATGFDDGDSGTSPATDTGTAGGDDDSGLVPISTCEDRDFPSAPVASRDDCEAPETTPAWDLVELWSTNPTYYGASPVIANLTDDDGDGVIGPGDDPDVVVAAYGGGVAAYRGSDGAPLWIANAPGVEVTTPAIGDLDGDGFPEVVVSSLGGTAALHGTDGSTYWTGDPLPSAKSGCGTVGIADFLGDGTPEVYFGHRIYDGQTGAVVADGAYGSGTTTSEEQHSVAADIDGDGLPELVVGNAVYEADGSALWYTGYSDGFPGVADLDGDGGPEIVSVRTWAVVLLDADGRQLWNTPMSSYNLGPPAIADVDGDGTPEILVTDGAGVSVLGADGSIRWRYGGTSSGGTMFDGASAYDLDGDGAWEVLYTALDGFYVLDGVTGAVRASFARSSLLGCGAYATVADLDHDGHAEIAVPGYTGSLDVLTDRDGFDAAFPIWNQAGWSITNVEEDGTIPTSAVPNWSVYNNFVAGPPADALYPSPNLRISIRDVCTDDCARGGVSLWVSVANDGVDAVTRDVPYAIWGVGPDGDVLLAEETWTADLPAGEEGEAVRVDVWGAPTPLYDVYAVVDPDDALAECDEDDQEDRWGEVVCP